MSNHLTVPPDVVEAIALRVAELLEGGLPAPRPAALMNATDVALSLGVTRTWVYDHADELGATRLGTGAKARLRFDPQKVADAMASCSTSRGSQEPESPGPTPNSTIRRRPRTGTRSHLLPIRGVNDPKAATDSPSEGSGG